MNPPSPNAFPRRQFVTDLARGGLGMIALGSMLSRDGMLAPTRGLAAVSPGAHVEMDVVHPLAPRAPHFAPKAKNCIFIFLDGGPSQMDLWDPKPKLNELHGQKLPPSLLEGVRFAFINKDATLKGSPRTFRQYGRCGMVFSDLLPQMATVADEFCMVRSMVTDQFNHHPAQLMFQCGQGKLGLPAMGSWLGYGLGSENQNLPGYVVMAGGRGTSGASTLWQSGFLNSAYGGVLLRTRGEPVLNLSNPPGVSADLRRRSLVTLRDLNEAHFQQVKDPELQARIAAYELAFRMQSAVGELRDLSGESPSLIEDYGVNRQDANIKVSRDGGPRQYRDFSMNCLTARRLIERGVRFVNIFHGFWDHHENVDGELPFHTQMVDQPIATLVKDLKARGMLDETLVVIASEFGRTPLGQGVAGRDHHPYAFTILLAGGGVKPGYIHGETDEIGWSVVRDPVHVNDLQATLLHLFGLDHLKLTYRFKGLDQRLTSVTRESHVVKALLA